LPIYVFVGNCGITSPMYDLPNIITSPIRILSFFRQVFAIIS
jgi:hypothetical protein